MNNKENMIWQLSVAISALIIVVFAYQLYTMHTTNKKLWIQFEKEEVGTDKNLQDKVMKLEKNLMDRNMFKFKMKKNPGDLANVIDFEGIAGNNYGNRHFDLELVFNSKRKGLFASVMHKNISYRVFKGDTIAGGKILSISEKEKKLVFEKDGEIFEYYAE
tara:strand:- start:1507 stop:1989 length:483 start_codon:yes stop_codon:yes gene_type:complete